MLVQAGQLESVCMALLSASLLTVGRLVLEICVSGISVRFWDRTRVVWQLEHQWLVFLTVAHTCARVLTSALHTFPLCQLSRPSVLMLERVYFYLCVCAYVFCARGG